MTDLARKPAFPNAAPLTGGMDRTGITVRQYYKAMAAQGLLVGAGTGGEELVDLLISIGGTAGDIADALIAEDEEHADGQ